MSPREHEFRLADIIDHIGRISFAHTQLEGFENQALQNPEAEQSTVMAFDAILYNLVVIGEAVKSLDPIMKARHTYIDWQQISGLRDFLAHQYFHIEASIVRSAIAKPLHQLQEVCQFESGR